MKNSLARTCVGPSTLGMEGVAKGTTTLTLILKEGVDELCRDTVRVTVIDLDVTWETNTNPPQAIATPNDHPSHAAQGGSLGVKYFPGATGPGGGFSDFVQVRVATDPAVANVRVLLKALDPDDPSANNDAVDGDLVGPDNRDGNHLDTGELGLVELLTGANGEDATTFRVAHQPGDNHRIAATMKQLTNGTPTLDQLDDTNVPPSNTNPPTQDQPQNFIGNVSKLLTVWRTLHVERDVMQAPVT